MNSSSYREKLIQFNNTEKYRSELEFLSSLLNPRPDERILDYGCGLGTAMSYLSERSECDVYGYDVEEYIENHTKCKLLKSVSGKFGKIYFMHSIAHIININQILRNLFSNNMKKDSEIVVITPNISYDKMYKKIHRSGSSFRNDETVIKHYDLDGINKMFLSIGFEPIISGLFGKSILNIPERIFVKVRKPI